MLANLPYSICIYCFAFLNRWEINTHPLSSWREFSRETARLHQKLCLVFLFFPSVDLIRFNSVQLRYIWRTFSVPGTEGVQRIISIIFLFSKHLSATSQIHPRRPFSSSPCTHCGLPCRNFDLHTAMSPAPLHTVGAQLMLVD